MHAAELCRVCRSDAHLHSGKVNEIPQGAELPKHSTGTTLAFCCMASLTKPAHSQSNQHKTRQLHPVSEQHAVLKGLQGQTKSLACMRDCTFVFGIDHKFLFARETACVDELGLSSWHKYDRSPLVQSAYECPSRDLQAASPEHVSCVWPDLSYIRDSLMWHNFLVQPY